MDKKFISKREKIEDYIGKRHTTEWYMEIGWYIERWDDRKVWGIASREMVDSYWDIITYDAMKNAFPDYLKFGNIREMHQPTSAVWVVKAHEFLEEEKATFIVVKIVDDNVWTKIKEWVYKGFSIWGKIVDASFEMRDWEEIFVITKIELYEISVVDRPACPDAVMEWYKFNNLQNKDMIKWLLGKFFKGDISEEELMIKVDAVEEVEVKEEIKEEDVEKTVKAEEVAEEVAEEKEDIEKQVWDLSEKQAGFEKTVSKDITKLVEDMSKLMKGIEFIGDAIDEVSKKVDTIDEIKEDVDKIKKKAGVSTQKTVETTSKKYVSFKDLLKQ